MLKIGDIAPDFLLPNKDGTAVSLASFKGQKVILYFYPKDNTPGCSKEACSFRDNYSSFKNNGIVVIGISPDSENSHNKFTDKLNLPFILLSDTEKIVAKAYGVWGEKKNYGKTYYGIIRTTFVIDENGIIERIYPKVNVATHAEDIIKDLEIQ